MLAAPASVLQSRFDLRERLAAGAEVRSRLYSWLIAADMARDRPVFGQGIGGYPARFWEFVVRRQSGPSGPWFEETVLRMNGVPPVQPHNEYLGLAAEQGLAGLCAFLLWVACGLSAAWQAAAAGSRPRRLGNAGEIGFLGPAFGAGLAASLTDACFMFPYHLAVSHAAFLFVLAGLAAADSEGLSLSSEV